MECTEIQSIAAQALYNIENGIRPVVFKRKVIEAKVPRIFPKVAAFFFAAFFSASLLMFVHFSGILKDQVSGSVSDSRGIMACNLHFYSSSGMISSCSTNAAGVFKTKLYAGTYRVVVEKRPGLPKSYQSISTTPLRIKAGKRLEIKIVN